MAKDAPDQQPISEEARPWNALANDPGIGANLREHDGHLALFDHFPIRRSWYEGEWWYSLVDCMAP